MRASLGLLKKLFMSAIRIYILLAVFWLGLNFVIGPAYDHYISEDTKIIKEYKDYTLPLKNELGSNYCSSSVVSYRGKSFVVTNNHCCEYGLTLFGENEVRVGNFIEKVVHRSAYHDVCILTSHIVKSPIKLADAETEHLDKILVMGYPRGGFLTPRWGHVLAHDVEVCISENNIRDCKPSNFLSSITFGGNSGSPVFNSKGELVNLIYAGSPFIHTFGISVPLFFIKESLDAAYNKSN